MKETKVLYVVNSSLATPTGGGRTRVIAAAKQATEHGFNVVILCVFPPQQLLLRFFALLAGKAALTRESGCRVHYFPTLPLTRVGWLRWLNNWYGGWIVRLLCWRHNIEVVHGHGLRATTFALLARRIKGHLRIVADVHGATTEEYLYERKLTRHDAFAYELEQEESRMLRESNWLIFVSHGMQKFYEEKLQMRFTNFSVIPCATESNFAPEMTRRNLLRQENGLNDRLVFCYVGACESYQLPETMCRLFRQVHQQFPAAFFLIFSHHRAAFLQELTASGISPEDYRVMSVPHDRIFDLLQMADIGLLLRDKSIVNRVASPTKFAEYCLCGVPLIATDGIGDVSDLVRQHQLGLIANIERLRVDDELQQFIGDVKTNRAEYAARGVAFARQYFSWTIYGGELARIYQTDVPADIASVPVAQHDAIV